MAKTKNRVSAKARKKRLVAQAKGYFGRRKNVWKVAKGAVEKSLSYAYEGRKQRKRQFRRLWIQRINAAARLQGMSYSVFMDKLNASGLQLNRKTLANLAVSDPEGFASVAASVKKKKTKVSSS